MDLSGDVERHLEHFVARLQREVLLDHRNFEVDCLLHALGRAIEIIAPQRRIDPDGVIVFGRQKEADDIRSPGIKKFDLELQMKRCLVAVRKAPSLDEWSFTRSDARVLTIGEFVLIRSAEAEPMALHVVAGYFADFTRPERITVDEREMRHVEKIVGQ